MASKIIHQVESEDIKVEYELIDSSAERNDEKRAKRFYEDYFEVTNEIKRLTNNVDGVDRIISAACGTLAGMLDVFFVGDFGSSYDDIDKKLHRIVEKKAREIEQREKEQKIDK